MYGKVLRLLRLNNDYKTQEMSDILNISQGYLSEIENDKKEPSLEVLKKYSQIFKVPLSGIIAIAESIHGEKEDDSYRKKIALKMFELLSYAEEK